MFLKATISFSKSLLARNWPLEIRNRGNVKYLYTLILAQ